MQQTMETACLHLLTEFNHTHFAGYDPFDSLNSSLFQSLPLISNQRFFKLIWLQLHKRLPINLRPYLGVAPSCNPKAIALILMGLVYQYKRTQDKNSLELAKTLADQLIDPPISLKNQSGKGWGYPFPWQARAFFVERDVPNIIVTSYVANALALLKTEVDDPRYTDALIEAGRFIVHHLHEPQAHYFCYIPGEFVLVHNANLWGAVTVARAGLLSHQLEWLTLARRACEITIKAQQNNGSWVYGMLPHHQFIDGFHTAYNLEALHDYQQITGENSFNHAIKKGLTYYRTHFFEKNGAVKYYYNKNYPLDSHSVAQAILTLSKLGDTHDIETLKKIIEFAFSQLYSFRTHQFYYQKYRIFTNKISYLRWTQAWMYYSLSYLLYQWKEHE